MTLAVYTAQDWVIIIGAIAGGLGGLLGTVLSILSKIESTKAITGAAANADSLSRNAARMNVLTDAQNRIGEKQLPPEAVQNLVQATAKASALEAVAQSTPSIAGLASTLQPIPVKDETVKNELTAVKEAINKPGGIMAGLVSTPPEGPKP